MKHQISQTYQIQCARKLTQLPIHHPCTQLHGNTFVITFDFVGEIHPKWGWVEDYKVLENQFVRPVLKQLDHHFLNDIEGLSNPTTELLSLWIYNKVLGKTPLLKRVHVSEIPGTQCTFPAF